MNANEIYGEYVSLWKSKSKAPMPFNKWVTVINKQYVESGTKLPKADWAKAAIHNPKFQDMYLSADAKPEKTDEAKKEAPKTTGGIGGFIKNHYGKIIVVVIVAGAGWYLYKTYKKGATK